MRKSELNMHILTTVSINDMGWWSSDNLHSKRAAYVYDRECSRHPEACFQTLHIVEQCRQKPFQISPDRLQTTTYYMWWI